MARRITAFKISLFQLPLEAFHPIKVPEKSPSCRHKTETQKKSLPNATE